MLCQVKETYLYTVQITDEGLWPCLWGLLTVIQAHDLNSFIVINHYYYLLNIMALFIG